MLSPQQVKPYILHDDIRVANAAMEYFSDSYLFDHELMPLFLQKLRTIKPGETFYLHHAYHFPHTLATIADILELLKSSASDEQTKLHLSMILLNADFQILETIVPDLNEYSSKLAQSAKARIELANCPNEQVEEMFNAFINEADGKYYNEINTPRGELLVKELARRNIIDPDRVLEILDSAQSDNIAGYEAIFYAKLAGEMHLAPAIPILNKFMSWDDEVIPDVASKALIMIGSEEVVRQVAEQFETNPSEYYRLFASDIFGNIKLPSSEKVLLKLLEAEEELTIATKLADGLCRLGSKSCIPTVLEQIREGYDSGYLDLRESLYVNCIINSVEIPELSGWKQAFEDEEKNRNQLNGNFFGSLAPIVNNGVKIGRNDPCTCGSGKKYKKCCGA